VEKGITSKTGDVEKWSESSEFEETPYETASSKNNGWWC
jgi:hypothetical protein